MEPNIIATEWQSRSVDKFTFGHQISNFERLKTKGVIFIRIEYKYILPQEGKENYYNQTYFNRHGHYPPPRLTFKAYGLYQKADFLWYKYEAPSIGGSRNFVYINGVKHKLTDFLSD
ncbi:MAG TPA: hypothetical protein PLS49_08130 [Candidatus Woesebacteria bacterium]|nr:hypothetical protein [Candidatus Woesebacteria bacterium]